MGGLIAPGKPSRPGEPECLKFGHPTKAMTSKTLTRMPPLPLTFFQLELDSRSFDEVVVVLSRLLTVCGSSGPNSNRLHVSQLTYADAGAGGESATFEARIPCLTNALPLNHLDWQNALDELGRDFKTTSRT